MLIHVHILTIKAWWSDVQLPVSLSFLILRGPSKTLLTSWPWYWRVWVEERHSVSKLLLWERPVSLTTDTIFFSLFMYHYYGQCLLKKCNCLSILSRPCMYNLFLFRKMRRRKLRSPRRLPINSDHAACAKSTVLNSLCPTLLLRDVPSEYLQVLFVFCHEDWQIYFV